MLAAFSAAVAGFLLRSYTRLVEQGQGLRIVGRLTELIDQPSLLLQFAGRYYLGLFKGLVSPLTGLLDLPVALGGLLVSAASWLGSLPERSAELEAEASELSAHLSAAQAAIAAELHAIHQEGRLPEFAAAVMEAAAQAGGALQGQIVSGARQQGANVADELVEHFLTAPLPDLAEQVGQVVGTVVIEVVLLVFTEGIGNLIAKVGEAARALRPLSRAGAAVGEAVVFIGNAIQKLDDVIGLLASRTVLRPLMPLFEAVAPLVGRMRRFLRRLLGVGEEFSERDRQGWRSRCRPCDRGHFEGRAKPASGPARCGCTPGHPAGARRSTAAGSVATRSAAPSRAAWPRPHTAAASNTGRNSRRRRQQLRLRVPPRATFAVSPEWADRSAAHRFGAGAAGACGRDTVAGGGIPSTRSV